MLFLSPQRWNLQLYQTALGHTLNNGLVKCAGCNVVLFVSCICLINTSSPCAASTVPDSLGDYEIVSRKAVVSGFVDTERRKRSSVIGSAVMNGLRAVKTLLKGSMRIPAHKKYFKYARYADEYEKIGDYKKTMEDFVSVDPTNVKVYGLPKGCTTLHLKQVLSVTSDQLSAIGKRHFIMTSGLRQYIAGYTITNSRRYPIRRGVTFISALESVVSIQNFLESGYVTYTA